MQNSLSLSQYVKRRNGVPLGASHSMRNMLLRAFGAKSFPIFWHYWNPIWSYYLSRNVMRPLGTFLPLPVAIFMTFVVSGALHDLAVTLVKWELLVFFTPWFALMGLIVIISSKFGLSYPGFTWPIRALINSFFILSTLGFTYYLEYLYT
ncbi:acyltransferase [Paraglaciecola aestuariivivens]